MTARYHTWLIACLTTIYGCDSPNLTTTIPNLERVDIVTDSVRVSLPEAWTKTKARPLFGPCYICGPKEVISKMISDNEENSLVVTVTSYCAEPQFDLYKKPKNALQRHVKNLIEMERGDAACLDSLSNEFMTAVGLRVIRYQKPYYEKRIEFNGRRNRIVWILEGPMNDQTMNTFEEVQRSIAVAPDYLN